ncbi:MAG: flavin monoamine oxidase family protein [Actinomycetota bacterium]
MGALSMSEYVIAGAGPAGLYTAYRLLKEGMREGDTLTVCEWAQRVGGRIYSYTFPESISSDGLYCEFGGMRFATDSKFPTETSEGHVLVQNMIIELGLEDLVVPFLESPERMYYLRGQNVYENDIIDPAGLPYHFNAEFRTFLEKYVTPPYTADAILAGLATAFVPGTWGSNSDRPQWCSYFANGTVGQGAATTSFPEGTPVSQIGYWNLLYDQLGDEGFDYAADGNGYTSNVINWNSADAMQANNDYGSGMSYSRLNGGYGVLFDALAAAVESLMGNFPRSRLLKGTRLISLQESGARTLCEFEASNGGGFEVTADYCFLAMPRRSIEMVASTCAPDYVLNDESVRFYLESSIDQPAIKAVLVFAEQWWTSPQCTFAPRLNPGTTPPNFGGPSITDLPLRQIYYFGANTPDGPSAQGPYVLLASYDDMNYSDFWRQVEITGDYVEAPSLYRQPLIGPTQVASDSPLASLLVKQLAETHGMTTDQIPQPLAVYFQDWGQDPFGGGYHGWAAHYDICQVMDNVRAPYQKILGQPGPNLYVIGSCYSFDQAWVEGAFCTAESVVQEFLGLPAFRDVSNYMLVCENGTTR